MDDENISNLNSKAPNGSSAKILLLGSFDPEGERIIRDPYYVIKILRCYFFSCIILTNVTYYRMMALPVSKNATSNVSVAVLPFYQK